MHVLRVVWTVAKFATVHFLKTQQVICYFWSLPCLSRLGSSGFWVSDGINQVLPLSTAPLILPSLQSLETRLLVIFHFSAISDVVRNSMYSLQEMQHLLLSVFLRRNICNGLLPWLCMIWDANESVGRKTADTRTALKHGNQYHLPTNLITANMWNKSSLFNYHVRQLKTGKIL